MTLVSAIITTCKRKPEIVLRAFNSVLNQTYQNLEIIVVDDSPDSFSERDQVREAVEKTAGSARNRVQYLLHDSCRGACAARNTGIQHSRGEIIGFLDDDDEWLPQKVEVMVQKFDRPEIALVYSNTVSYHDDTGEKILFSDRAQWKGNVFDRLMERNFIGSTSYPLLRKSSVIDCGCFDEEMPAVQDRDLWLRIAAKYEVNYTTDILTVYHVHGGEQISSSVKKRIAGLEKIYEKHQDYLEGHPEIAWRWLMRMVPYYARDHRVKRAYETWRQAVKKRPAAVKENTEYLIRILKYYMIPMKWMK